MTQLRNQILLSLIALFFSTKPSFSQENKALNSESKKQLETINLSFKKNISPKIILDSLNKRGYVFAEISTKEDSLQIHFGELIKKIELSYTDLDGTKRIEKINFKDLDEKKKAISTKFREANYPFNKIKINSIERLDKNSLKIDLKTIQNQKQIIDELIIKGYTKLPIKQIKRILGFHNKSVNEAKIKNQLSRIEKKLGFRLTQNPKILYKEKSSTLYLFTEKNSKNKFDGILGFSNENESFKLNGDIELELHNNLNKGEKFKLEYKNTNSDQEIIKVELNHPYIFNTRFDLETDFEIYRQDSAYSNTKFKAGLNYDINRTLNVSSAYISKKSNAINELQNTDYTYNGGILNIGINLNDIGFISSGIEIGKRNNEPQYTAQIKYLNTIKFNERYELDIENDNSLFFSKSYFSNELFRSGGINSIRGFLENSIISTKHSLIRLDHNFILTQNLKLIGVTDFLTTYNDKDKQHTNYYSLGFGLNLLQNQTNISLIMANGFTKDNKIDLESTKIHIKLTTFF